MLPTSTTMANHIEVIVAPSRHDDDRDIATLADVLTTGFMRTTRRLPVIRTGERAEIGAHVRAAIWYRDHGRCALCPDLESQPEGALHLDHIIPWSAGGSDRSENLRLLCEQHNLERSNFVDFAGQKRAVTWWCHRCYGRDREWQYFDNGSVICPTHRRWGADGQQCRVVRAIARAAVAGELTSWHMREPLDRFFLPAYCAHCNLPGLTSVTL